MAVARMTLKTELPSAATIPMASTKSGKAMMVSLMRETIRSVQPPKTPAHAPARLPAAKDSATAEKAMAMSRRVATTTRLSMSRGRPAEQVVDEQYPREESGQRDARSGQD